MFARLFHREIRRAGGSGFHSLLVLHLAARPDVDALRAALADDTALTRGLRTPIQSRLPFLLPYFDDARQGAAPTVRVLDAPPAGGEPWPELLNESLDAGSARHIALTLFPAGDGTWRVAFLFQHLLMDAKGAERVLARLSEGEGAARWPEPRGLVADLGFGDIAQIARGQIDAIEEAVGPSLHVVGGVKNGTGAHGGTRAAGQFAGSALHLDVDETKLAVKAGRKAAGYAMEGLWYLACLLAAERDSATEPPAPGARFVVPLPTSLDRKGEDDRVFGNNLVFLFLSVPVEEAHDPRAVAAGLKKAMLGHLKERSDRASQAQMEFCKRLPGPLHGWLARRTMGGSFGSLFFTNPGPSPSGLDTFFGTEVTRLAHYPLTAPVPGVCGVTWTHRGSLGLALTWLRGRVDEARAQQILTRWRERILEVPE